MPPRLKEKLPMDSGIRDLEVPFQPSWLGDAVRDDGYVPDHVDEGLGEPEDLADDRVVEGGGRKGGHSLEDADAGDRVVEPRTAAPAREATPVTKLKIFTFGSSRTAL
jgi:hypothetical protein